MAWPGEQTHKEYMDYVLQQQEAGQPALPKDQWLQQKTESVKSVTDAMMRKQ